MDSKTLLIGIGVLVILGGGGWYYMSTAQSAPAPATNVQPTANTNQPKSVTHSLKLAVRKLTPDIVTVTQGDQVTIKVMSDEAGEFHVSGYEIENDMEAGKELSFSFTADKAGRYNFELHPKEEEPQASLWFNVAEASETEGGAAEEDIVVGAFVVNPR